MPIPGIGTVSTCFGTDLSWMPQNPLVILTLIQVMVSGNTPLPYQSWPGYMSPYGVTGLQWVKSWRFRFVHWLLKLDWCETALMSLWPIPCQQLCCCQKCVAIDESNMMKSSSNLNDGRMKWQNTASDSHQFYRSHKKLLIVNVIFEVIYTNYGFKSYWL